MRNWVQGSFIIASVVLGCVVATSITTRAQLQRPVEQQTPDKVVINAGEVPFDVVVRDKNGRPIKDLTVSDFEVYEDGVKQQINSFRFVSSAAEENRPKLTNKKDSSTGTGSNVSKKEVTDSAEPNVSAVALVFDRLSPESRARAREAALSYLGESVKKSEQVGVFLVDLSTVVLQPFTRDAELIKAGIENAGVYATSAFKSTNAAARHYRSMAANGLVSQGGGSAPPEPGTEMLSAAALMVLQALEYQEEMQRDQQGNATAHGLLHIASALRVLPGRKAVIFFSEGLVLPPNVIEAFRAVINEANRGNVSFYAIDVAGLRTDSKTAETKREIISRSDLRMAQLGGTAEPGGPMTKGLERNEDLLRLNPDTGLGQLANETGGFLITDSNDLTNRIQRVDEDLHSYYLLSYSSNNQKYDGHFRKIEVKLKRSDVSVQSRKGYYAVKSSFASPVLSYEAPVLAAFENAPKADSFPFYVGGFSFPDRQRLGRTVVMADVAMSAFTMNVDQAKKSYNTDFSIVTLVKNQAGEVVAKLSNQYQLSGTLDKAEEAKKGRVLFYREVNLPPDRYTLETIAYDAPTARASVRATKLEVLAMGETSFRLSDVTLLKRAEPANGADENRTNPFHVSNMIVIPFLGEAVSKSMKQVPFFFTVYIPSGLAKPKLTIELSRDGNTLAQLPGELPDADVFGRSQFVGGLPLEKIPAGSYELKITISSATTISRSRSFTIVD